jgi:3-isopropylmalate/(R)-2-methylmalate dehydratase small subunit
LPPRLRIINVDTDMVIPKAVSEDHQAHRFGKGLFSERRYKDDGSENPDFGAEQAGLSQGHDSCCRRQLRLRLVARARAVGLMDFGIRCVISTSFGDIFYNNASRTGGACRSGCPRKILKTFSTTPSAAPRDADGRPREAGNPRPGWRRRSFRHRPAPQALPAEPVLTISVLTQQKQRKIESYEKKAGAERPWA